MMRYSFLIPRANAKYAYIPRIATIYGIGTLLLLFGSSAIALDRAVALKVIQNSEYYPRYETLTPLPLGNPVNIKVVVQTISNQDRNLAQAIDTGYACAKKLGYIDIRAESKKVFGTDMGTFYHVKTTGDGLINGWIVNEELYGYKQGYVMPIYKETAMRITGIKTPDSTTAIVDVEAGITDILPSGTCVYPDIENKRNTVKASHRVTLGLFDDGWRVEKAQAKGKNVDWIDMERASDQKISK